MVNSLSQEENTVWSLTARRAEAPGTFSSTGSGPGCGLGSASDLDSVGFGLRIHGPVVFLSAVSNDIPFAEEPGSFAVPKDSNCVYRKASHPMNPDSPSPLVIVPPGGPAGPAGAACPGGSFLSVCGPFGLIPLSGGGCPSLRGPTGAIHTAGMPDRLCAAHPVHFVRQRRLVVFVRTARRTPYHRWGLVGQWLNLQVERAGA